jgi:hypothetical protein
MGNRHTGVLTHHSMVAGSCRFAPNPLLPPQVLACILQTCQPVRFWHIFPILGLNFALSTIVRFKAKKISFFTQFFFFNLWKWSPESFYSLQNAKLCLLLPYNCTCSRKKLRKKVAFYAFSKILRKNLRLLWAHSITTYPF